MLSRVIANNTGDVSLRHSVVLRRAIDQPNRGGPSDVEPTSEGKGFGSPSGW